MPDNGLSNTQTLIGYLLRLTLILFVLAFAHHLIEEIQ